CWFFLCSFLLYLIQTNCYNFSIPEQAEYPVMGSHAVFAGVQVLRTWILVAIGELFFRAEGLRQGIRMFCSMIRGWRFSQLWDGSLLELGLDRMDFWVIGVMVGAVYAGALLSQEMKYQEVYGFCEQGQ
ncbi:hypothetical protein AALB16_05605, partial [Lachnospiraceae bacterium 62-35]